MKITLQNYERETLQWLLRYLATNRHLIEFDSNEKYDLICLYRAVVNQNTDYSREEMNEENEWFKQEMTKEIAK